MACQYVIPFIYLILAYTRMSLKLWRSPIPGKDHKMKSTPLYLISLIPGNSDEGRDINLIAKKKKSIKMMTSVVVIFGICWLPFFIFKMVKIFWAPFEE